MAVYHVLFAGYGSFMFWAVMFGEIKEKHGDTTLGLLELYSKKELFIALLWQLWNFGWSNKFLTFCAINAMACAVMLPPFVIYHLNNLGQNRTTNEQLKANKLKRGLKNQRILYKTFLAKTKKHAAEGKKLERFSFDHVEIP
jgi:hypothetical protein